MARDLSPAEREIHCTQCDGRLVVAAEAKSVSCIHCHQRVVCEALVVKEYVAVRVFRTANSMHITRKGIVYAAVRAETLRIEGQLQGEAVALDSMHVGKTARIVGDLRAARLRLDEGATLCGEVCVGESDPIPLTFAPMPISGDARYEPRFFSTMFGEPARGASKPEPPGD